MSPQMRNVHQLEKSNNAITRPSISTNNLTMQKKEKPIQQPNERYEQQKQKEQTPQHDPKNNNTVLDRKISLKDGFQPQKISMARKESRGGIPNNPFNELLTNSTNLLRTWEDPPTVRPKDLPGYRPPTGSSRDDAK